MNFIKLSVLFLTAFYLVQPLHSNNLRPEEKQQTCSIDKDECEGCPLSGKKSTNRNSKRKQAGSIESYDTDSINNEFNSIIDEEEFLPATEEFSESPDEFSGTLNEFSPDKPDIGPKKSYKHIINLFVLFVLILLTGVLIQNKIFRKLRPLFLLSMLVWLGFIQGGCPCMISSFQNFLLLISGNKVSWTSVIWFLGLIPLTYLFGRIWCGWLCHLGAFQEFLFGASRLNFLRKEKHQRILKSIQIGVFIILVVQLFVTRTNIFVHYDPFKVAFNLFSANTLGYILLGILLISSVMIYRPFCRGFCPVGLILGWTSQISGAKNINIQSSCTGCSRCSTMCKSSAITNTNNATTINSEDCIFCGECLDNCNKEAINIE